MQQRPLLQIQAKKDRRFPSSAPFEFQHTVGPVCDDASYSKLTQAFCLRRIIDGPHVYRQTFSSSGPGKQFVSYLDAAVFDRHREN